MTPDTTLASINRVVDEVGENIVLARPASPTTPGIYSASLSLRVFVRPERIAGAIGNVQVIASPRDLATWDVQTGGVAGDPMVPHTTDKLIIQGRRRDIKAVRPIYLDGVLVRVEMEATP